MEASIKNIKFVQFGFLTDLQWRRYKVCDIKTPYSHGGPTQDTVYDERMGVIDNGKPCLTCGELNNTCPGHYGIISLPEPIYNPKCMRIVFQILKCICLRCANLRIRLEDIPTKYPEILKLKRNAKLKAIVKICESITECVNDGCADLSSQEKIIPNIEFKQSDFQINTFITDKKTSYQLLAKECHEILIRISKDTFKYLGFNDNLSLNPQFTSEDVLCDDEQFHVHQVLPSSFIFTVLPVIPPCARTYVIKEGVKHNDDLTEQYNAIVKTIQNYNQIAKTMHQTSTLTPAHIERKMKEYIKTIQQGIFALIDNHIIKAKSSGGRPGKSFQERVQGKGGRVQLNVVAKRTDYSARAVITADPTLRVGWISIPKYVAETQTKPVRAVDSSSIGGLSNIVYLQNLVDTGKVNGVQRDGCFINIKHRKQKFEVKVGDIIERHLQNGDWVLFNRQPTLRKESIMGVQIMVRSDSIASFGMPLAVTHPFNADFDGDEMNLHNAQSAPANAEMMILLATKNLIVSGQNNSPVCGLNQDSLVASYIMTNFDEEITWNKFFDCIMDCDNNLQNPKDALFYKLQNFYKRAYKYYPKYFERNKNKKTKEYRPNGDEYEYHPNRNVNIPTKVAYSILFPHDFCFTKETQTNSDFPSVKINEGIILPDSGPLCKKVIGAKSQNSIIHFLWKEYSPTICSDFLSNAQFFSYSFLTARGFSIGLSDCIIEQDDKKKIRQLLSEVDAECRSILSSNETSEKREQLINQRLNVAMGDVGGYVSKKLPKGNYNAQTIMIKSGAKGSIVNCTQISGFVGQQNIGGRRILKQLSGGTRCLPHFEPNDDSPEARGFVYSNFLDSLKFYEVFFSSAGGREGIINTALRTAETGYFQKRIGRKIEDARVGYDGSVKDASSNIISFLYGDDGMNPKMIYNVPKISYPFFINVSRLSERINLSHTNKETRSLTSSQIEQITSSIKIGLNIKIKNPITAQTEENLRNKLRNCLKEIKLVNSPDAFKELCDKIIYYFETSKIENGDMVGLDATPAIGEPSTQLVLSSFHYSGICTKATTTGVPKLCELLGVSKKPKTPSCQIYLNDSYLKNISLLTQKSSSDSEKELLKIDALNHLAKYKYFLEELTIDQLLDRYQLFYIPIDGINIKQRTSSINLLKYEKYVKPWWYNISKDIVDDTKIDRWVIRLYLSTDKLYEKKITLQNIASVIQTNNSNFACICSPINYGIIDIFYNYSELVSDIVKNYEFYNDIKTPENIDFFFARDVSIRYLRTIPIRGIYGIKKIFFQEDKKTNEWYIDTEGSNLPEILSLNSIPIDRTRTTSDHIWEMYNTFDIDACRSFLIKEFINIICSDNTYVNPRHFSLLVDTMTRTGIPTMVHRDGIDRSAGPIAKGMFEKSVESFYYSGIFTEKDEIKGFSASIMFGVLTEMGTGSVKLRKVEDSLFTCLSKNLMIAQQKALISKQNKLKQITSAKSPNVKPKKVEIISPKKLVKKKMAEKPTNDEDGEIISPSAKHVKKVMTKKPKNDEDGEIISPSAKHVKKVMAEKLDKVIDAKLNPAKKRVSKIVKIKHKII
jgi:DNA-directed RNA polymerase beta' subunit